ncbi:hypothetical protein LIER_19666 [Lithospermum erythrorhizon]|uniref:Uncharacterized protein n=1 Tax=Lithospermum erythrorhizon TaxID=34254 RepID=A0AAV3QMW1_LITER
MANTISQTIIRTLKSNPNPHLLLSAKSSLSMPRLVAVRGYSVPPNINVIDDNNNHADMEAMAVRKIENAIHQIMVLKSVPDWLPFVPGGSYWIPPVKRINGIHQILHTIANPLRDEEYLSLTNVRGWPSSGFHASPEMKKSASSKSQFEDLMKSRED